MTPIKEEIFFHEGFRVGAEAENAESHPHKEARERVLCAVYIFSKSFFTVRCTGKKYILVGLKLSKFL